MEYKQCTCDRGGWFTDQDETIFNFCMVKIYETGWKRKMDFICGGPSCFKMVSIKKKKIVKNRYLKVFIKPKLFATELELQNRVKNLGVILDSKLNWNSHIDPRLRKVTIAWG
jgi:hypothetical protein